MEGFDGGRFLASFSRNSNRLWSSSGTAPRLRRGSWPPRGSAQCGSLQLPPLLRESPAAERRAKLGRGEGARVACVDAAPGAALGAVLRALLPLSPPERCSSRSATGGGEAGGQPGSRGVASESQSLDCAEHGELLPPAGSLQG